MILEQKVGLGAEYSFFNKVDGELVPLLNGAKSKNLVPTVFLDYLVNSPMFTDTNYEPAEPSTSAAPSTNRIYFCQRLAVGTGSLEPALTDTGLVNSVAQINAPNVVSSLHTYDDVNKYIQWKITATFTFGLGAIAANLSEVGLFSWTRVASAQTFQSRTLIKDELGDPATLPITVEDQLVVVVEFYVRVPYAFSSYNQEYNLVNYTLDYRLYFDSTFSSLPKNAMFYSIAAIVAPATSSLQMAGATGTSWTMADTPQGSIPGLVAVGFPDVTVQNPNTAVKRRRFRLGLAEGNFAGGLAGIMANVRYSQQISNPNRVSWHFQFTPKLPKDNTFILEIEVFTTYGNL